MEIKDIKPKYVTGESFKVIGTYSNRWWTIVGVEIGVNEPIYTLREMPRYDYFTTIRENDLDKSYYKTTNSNL